MDSAWGPLVDVVDPGIEGFPYIKHTSLLIVHGQDELGAFIEVFAEDAGTIVASKRLREGVHFTCTPAGLEVTRDWHFININVGPALEKYRHVFHKDPQDGALVLHTFVQDRALVLFIIPVWGGDETWMRWRELQTPNVKDGSG